MPFDNESLTKPVSIQLCYHIASLCHNELNGIRKFLFGILFTGETKPISQEWPYVRGKNYIIAVIHVSGFLFFAGPIRIDENWVYVLASQHILALSRMSVCNGFGLLWWPLLIFKGKDNRVKLCNWYECIGSIKCWKLYSIWCHRLCRVFLLCHHVSIKIYRLQVFLLCCNWLRVATQKVSVHGS